MSIVCGQLEQYFDYDEYNIMMNTLGLLSIVWDLAGGSVLQVLCQT